MNDLVQLNEAQMDAVQTIEGALLVLAGAGSGKTRVVTYRIAHLLEQGVPASKILGLTFTNKAAGEMKERVHKITNSHVMISTFHSLGVRILRESAPVLNYRTDFTIYDEDDVQKLLKSCLDELKIKDKAADPKAFRALISRAKNKLQGPEDVCEGSPSDLAEFLLPKVYASYQSHLKEYNALDFDDLLYLTVKLFREHPETLQTYQDRWSFLLVDEYQDTNHAQYEMIRCLVAHTGNLCVVGDPDQSIYSWRGANIQNILNFEQDFKGAKVIRLEQNYRSRSNILEAANDLIGFNMNRYEKNLWSDLGPGEKIKHFTAENEQEEARFVSEMIRHYHVDKGIPLKDMVIFYRTNFQSRVFEDRFLADRVSYVIVGGISFYQRREIKDILAFLRMVQSESDFISFTRTLNMPKRGLGDATVEKIRMGALLDRVSILQFCETVVQGGSAWKPTAKQKQSLEDYLSVIRKLKKISQECSLKELVRAAIEESGYLTYLYEDPETFDDRKSNLEELIAKAAEWELAVELPTLSGFLEELSLKSSLDESGGEEDRVNLMTIHNGKGLEFTTVFLVGLEEDLFPHVNSRGSHEALEEERRLCYVGMTRAKEYLYLTEARFRFLWGSARAQRPSRFLREIPRNYLQAVRRSHPFERVKEVVKEEPVAQKFSKGDAVYHADFGVGIVQNSYETSVGLTYTILFSKEMRVKEIVAKYAQLKKL